MVPIFPDLCNRDFQPVFTAKKEWLMYESKIEVISNLDVINALWKYHVTDSLTLSANEWIFDDHSSERCPWSVSKGFATDTVVRRAIDCVGLSAALFFKCNQIAKSAATVVLVQLPSAFPQKSNAFGS